MEIAVRKPSAQESETFVVDGAYFRAQAREALRRFVAPLAGVYDAARGTPIVGDDRQQQKVAKKHP
jgi:hypothetical protein